MRTLPERMLRHSADLLIAAAVSPWKEAKGVQRLTLERVHVQRERSMYVENGNVPDVDVRPAAQLWYDCRLSKPSGLDWMRLQSRAEAAGTNMVIEHEGLRYRVMKVEELCDGFGRAHHVRLELI